MNTSGYLIVNTDELQYYLKDLRRIPVVSHERQDEIFKLLKNNNISQKEKTNLKNELISGNLRFVITIAKLYQNQGLDLLDLISEGNLGLIKAIDKYDIDSQNKFISYAVWWIRQSIMSALNDYSRTIRIPSNIVQEQEKNKKKSFEELSEEDVIKMDFSLPYCISLSERINEEGDELIDVVQDPNEQTPDILVNNKFEIRKRIDRLLSCLDEREKLIIEKYYGLNGTECNLDDLGEYFNCTKERIRQLKDKGIKKLRNDSYNILNIIY